MANSPNLKREITKVNTSMSTDEPNVLFKNSSWIKVVASTPLARSARAHICVYDEFRLIKLDILTKVLRRFLGTPRQPGYLRKPEYKHLKERNKEIYLSSATLKVEWAWTRFQAFVKSFTAGKKYFVCGLPYQLSIKEGLLMEEQVLDEMQEEDFSEVSWKMEMEALFHGESEKAYFNYGELNQSREIIKPSLPMTDEEFVKLKGDRKKHKFYKPKKKNEIRVMGVDTALMGGRINDQTVFTFIRCLLSGNEYIKFVEYIETLEGVHSAKQALRLKQIFYDLDCDYCVMDAQGNSISLYDDVTKITVDNVRGVEYPAWASMNDDAMRNRAYDENAIPLIYSIKAAGPKGTEINHQMANYTKAQFEKNKIRLLCSEIEGKDYIVDNEESLKLNDDEKRRMIASYYQVTRLIYEMINLETTIKSGFIKLVEPRNQRKDRYSSLSYPLYYIRELESDLRVQQQDINEFDLLSQYTYV